MKVIIVSRTMCGRMRCIGGIAMLDDGHLESVRLMNPGHLVEGVRVEGNFKGFWYSSIDFQIGEIWDLDLAYPAEIIMPHTEDRIVCKIGERYGKLSGQELENFLFTAANNIHDGILWRGAPSYLYDCKLNGSKEKSSKGYINTVNLPSCSTGFWISDQDLVYQSYYDIHKKSESGSYVYEDGQSHEAIDRMCYVGESPEVDVIPAGTLLRVSLTRRYYSERHGWACWLQLSGWF